ncbi:hypothetical protein [Streptomyces sp. 900105755]
MDYTKAAKPQTNDGCLQCGAPLTQTEGAGRIRRYCSAEHGRLWRRRMRHSGFYL